MIGSCGVWLTSCAAAEQLPADDETEDELAESTGTTGEFEPLIEHSQWEQIESAAEDPLAAHRPSAIECGAAGWFEEIETETVEIDTNFCNYLALRQPSLAAITQGRAVRLGFYYFDLVAPESALAHLAIVVDGQLLWEQEVEIPGDAMVHALEFEAPHSAPVGAEVVFHLHNHGQNTWALQSLSAEQ